VLSGAAPSAWAGAAPPAARRAEMTAAASTAIAEGASATIPRLKRYTCTCNGEGVKGTQEQDH